VLVIRVLLSFSLVPDPVFLLDLPLDLLLSMHALFVDGLGLLWGQPKLGSHRFWVYGRWWCESGACGGGVLLCRLASLLSFRLLCSLLVLPFSSLSILSHLTLPSLLLTFPPFSLVLCDPFGLLANGVLADCGEFCRGYS
jgi:hypothetical protein